MTFRQSGIQWIPGMDQEQQYLCYLSWQPESMVISQWLLLNSLNAFNYTLCFSVALRDLGLYAWTGMVFLWWSYEPRLPWIT